MAKKANSVALATELFARLDAARAESPGGSFPRSAVITIAARFIDDEIIPKKKSVKFADMSDEGFKDYLLNTYTWLDVDRELAKCSAWVKVNIAKSTGPTRRRIINWMNGAKGEKVFSGGKTAPGLPALPIPEPEKWREYVKRYFSENSIWYRLVEDGAQWSEITRAVQIDIATYMSKDRPA